MSKILLRNYAIVEQDEDKISFLPSWSVDLGATCFGSTHAPYGALGILGGIFTVFLQLVLVLIYPTCVFPRLIRCFGMRKWHAMRMFMEVFTSSYKDGTMEDECDCRIFAAVYLIGQIFSATGLPWVKFSSLVQYFWLFNSISTTLCEVIIAFVKPRRNWRDNIVDILILLLLTKLTILLHVVFETNISEQQLKVLVIVLLIDLAIPQVVLLCYFCFKLLAWSCT